jgi:hypothetical protein
VKDATPPSLEDDDEDEEEDKDEDREDEEALLGILMLLLAVRPLGWRTTPLEGFEVAAPEKMKWEDIAVGWKWEEEILGDMPVKRLPPMGEKLDGVEEDREAPLPIISPVREASPAAGNEDWKPCHGSSVSLGELLQ